MTKLEMWSEVFEDKPSIIKQGENELEELYKYLTWKETRQVCVVLNWFRIHNKHKFLQYRSLIFYAGDVRDCYNFILSRYRVEMRMRGKRV